MAFLFGRSKGRMDLAKTAREQLVKLSDASANPKAEEDVAKTLNQMKQVLQGTQALTEAEAESNPEAVQQLVTAIIQEDLLYQLAISIGSLPFEARKDTQTIYSHVLRYKPPNSASPQPPAVAYLINNRPEVVTALCHGYEHRDSAMPCGAILREALKHDDIVFVILYDEPDRHFRMEDVNDQARASGQGIFWSFFTWIQRGAFEVSTDAFTTFRDILTKHKEIVGQYLSTNFDLFFSRYNQVLIQSSSYVTKRQSLKLLGEILLDRTNYNIMLKYVESGDHLKLYMNLLRDDRKMVQYEGFHVFKKSIAVQKILINNRDKLLKFLPDFLADRTDDDQFIDEKSFLVRTIADLPPHPVEPAA